MNLDRLGLALQGLLNWRHGGRLPRYYVAIGLSDMSITRDNFLSRYGRDEIYVGLFTTGMNIGSGL